MAQHKCRVSLHRGRAAVVQAGWLRLVSADCLIEVTMQMHAEDDTASACAGVARSNLPSCTLATAYCTAVRRVSHCSP